jgi:MFS family permease
MTTPHPSPIAPVQTEPTFSRQERLFTMTGTLLGLLLAALDQTIVSTAGHQIQKDLDHHLVPGRFDRDGADLRQAVRPVWPQEHPAVRHRRVPDRVAAVWVSGEPFLGTFLGGGTGQLIALRAVQGFSSAALFTTAFAVVSDLYPPAERGRYTGLFGAVFGLSSVLGPPIGGYFTDHLSWHWVFYVNLPIGAVALAFIISRMPALKHLYSQTEIRPRLNLLGALWLIVTVVPLLLALSLGKSFLTPGETGFLWGSWPILSMFALVALGLAAFLWTERRAPDPLMNLALFGNRVFSVGSAATFLLGMAFLGPIIFLPLFMVNVVGLNATSSGLTLTPLVLVAGNIFSGQLVSRIGKYKPIMLVSLILLMAAFLIMGLGLHPDSTQAAVTWKMVLIGLGLGPSIPLYTLAIQNAADPRLTGQVTSSVTFFRNLGQVVGVAILGTLFANTLSGQLNVARMQASAVLPAGDRASFLALGQGGASEGASVSNFDLGAITRTVNATLDAQAARVTRALASNDPASVRALLTDPQTPPALREVLQSGGVAAPVRAAFAELGARLERAVQTGQPGVLATLAQDPQLPQALRTPLQQGTRRAAGSALHLR